MIYTNAKIGNQPPLSIGTGRNDISANLVRYGWRNRIMAGKTSGHFGCRQRPIIQIERRNKILGKRGFSIGWPAARHENTGLASTGLIYVCHGHSLRRNGRKIQPFLTAHTLFKRIF